MDLTRDAILAAEDRPREKVSVPEWGGDVWVRTLSARERDDWEGRFSATRKPADVADAWDNFRASLVVRCACNGEGGRLFTDQDEAALGAKSCVAVKRVFEVAARLNAVGRDEQEEILKNSAGGPTGDSPTA